MIYLIPNWKQADNNLENDRILNITRLFAESGEQYKLFLLNYLPFLRYKAQEYSLFSDCYWRAYDVIQNVSLEEGHPLSIEDLCFPKDVESVYTPFGMVLLQNNQSYGEVTYNKYGCIERVKFFESDGYFIDYYDDRGFLSQKEFASKSNKIYKREYFNEYGEKTVTELLGDNPEIIIEEAGNDQLKKTKFFTMDEVVSAVLQIEFEKNKKNDKKILTTTDEDVLKATQVLQEKESLVRIVSDDNVLREYNRELFINCMKTAKSIVTDTSAKHRELLSVRKAYPALSNTSIHTIPMFNTELDLGMSNSVAQLIMYWRATQLSDVLFEANEVLIKNLISNTKYSLIIEVSTILDQSKFQELQKDFIDGYFDVDSESEDLKKAAHFIEAKRTKHLYKADELAIEEIRKTDSWKNLVKAIDVYNRIEFRVQPTLLSIRNDFQRTRLYIDISDKYDLQMQSLAISAGIPQITKAKTDFIEDYKNGRIIRRISELEPALSYFLENLSNWNNALVKNVTIIEDFSPQIILEKWRQALNG